MGECLCNFMHDLAVPSHKMQPLNPALLSVLQRPEDEAHQKRRNHVGGNVGNGGIRFIFTHQPRSAAQPGNLCIYPRRRVRIVQHGPVRSG